VCSNSQWFHITAPTALDMGMEGTAWGWEEQGMDGTHEDPQEGQCTSFTSHIADFHITPN